MHISQSAHGLSRREWLRLSTAGVMSTSLSGWLPALARAAAARTTRPKSCILLWMAGGPSHKDTFDPKPGTAHGGPLKAIPTAVPGIAINELWPNVAKLTKHTAIIRGMSTPEGEHDRASYHLHTGYRQGVGGLVYPSIGSLTAAELGRGDLEIPNFVVLGAHQYSGLGRSSGAGFLGPRFEPLVVKDPVRGIPNLAPSVRMSQFDERMNLLEEAERGFYKNYQAPASQAHQTTLGRAVQLMRSAQVKAFDLTAEPAATQEAYGRNRMGEACLTARRLVEAGVSFVEVGSGSWDDHGRIYEDGGRTGGGNSFKLRSREVDQAMAALVADLDQRGLLESTLIIWMGEFGRTPKINAGVGRDHYPKAWSAVLAGGGIKGGQVIGKTDAEGAEVVDRPVSVLDLLATVCLSLGINYKKQNASPGGRPIRLVDKGENPITELLG